MLFATFQDSFGLLLMVCFFFYATNRLVKKVSGSPTARTVGTKVAGHFISRLFK